MSCIYYLAVLALCLIISFLERVIKMEIQEKESMKELLGEAPGAPQDSSGKQTFTLRERIGKLCELLHAPSSMMIFCPSLYSSHHERRQYPACLIAGVAFDVRCHGGLCSE